MKAEYIFERNHEADERSRLRLIEEALDPASIPHLERTGIESGWRCLELGAGAGSMMRWLGNVVGPIGRVVGVDRNTSHLRHLSDSRFQIIEGDFLEISLDAAFNLAHCRYVFIHNRGAAQMLTKLAQVLKPRGFLVVEEPDFTSAKLLNRRGDVSQQRVNNAICRMFEDRVLDPAHGLSLPEKVAAEGLDIVEC
ncbi:MAG: methyltransferase domain-containing protein [Verrucomicrobia bacterium]|nr:methyltransferase domain-containing protein [Verrucomicrobiota bacterium]